MSRVPSANGLPERIAGVRQRLALSQGRFAASIGVTRNAVIRDEGERNRPRADTLDRIAKAGGRLGRLAAARRREPGRRAQRVGRRNAVAARRLARAQPA
jgi:transcriptional regulator with XRE-family HTH domain